MWDQIRGLFLISIHTPARGVTYNTLAAEVSRLTISIHTPARGVTPWMIKCIVILPISIHTPARGVTMVERGQWPILAISIHTPARGVTHAIVVLQHSHIISIHTPARGVTKMRILRQGKCGNFNPHSRKGSDIILSSLIYHNNNFNPHSRKGSDLHAVQKPLSPGISIHTPARGVTTTTDLNICRECLFQSTLPQGE